MRPSYVIAVLVLAVVPMGCSNWDVGIGQNEPVATAGESHRAGSAYSVMSANAVEAELTLADVHFVPGQASLNGLGEQRLAQCTKTLERYGGTLRYDPQTTDEALIERRVASVTETLAVWGLDPDKVSVVVGMAVQAGASGADAVDTIRALRGDAEGGILVPVVIGGGG